MCQSDPELINFRSDENTWANLTMFKFPDKYYLKPDMIIIMKCLKLQLYNGDINFYYIIVHIKITKILFRGLRKIQTLSLSLLF